MTLEGEQNFGVQRKMPEVITILGSKGFVGSNLARKLEHGNTPIFRPEREEALTGRDLGIVYYCIGLTSDYRSRPFDTVEAHVCKLKEVLQNCRFDSLIYLSSTKIYLNASSTDEESSLIACPQNPEESFAISKLMGESLCINSGRANVKVARLSNVLGNDFASGNFIFSLICDAIKKGQIVLRSDLDSEKDYIHIDDVIEQLVDIGERGSRQVYNVAYGSNTTHRSIVDVIKRETGCVVEVSSGSPKICFPEIRTDRMTHEFFRKPTCILEYLPTLIHDYRSWSEQNKLN